MNALCFSKQSIPSITLSVMIATTVFQFIAEMLIWILLFSVNLASIYDKLSAPFNIIRPCNLDRRTVCSKSELLITDTCAAVTTTPIISLLLTCIFIYIMLVSILSAYKVGMGGPWLLILREQLEVVYWYKSDGLKGGLLIQSLKV
jgi:hypothetical protein